MGKEPHTSQEDSDNEPANMEDLDEVIIKAACHDECVPLAEAVRQLQAACEAQRLVLKGLRDELAEAQAAHTSLTLSLKADERILPLFDQPPDPGRADGPPPYPVQPEDVADVPDWWDVPLQEVFQDEGGGGFLRKVVQQAIELLDLFGVLTAGQFYDRQIGYPGCWHRGIGRVRGKGISDKTAKAMDEEFDVFVARHEKEGRK